jgi:hypothetical protein
MEAISCTLSTVSALIEGLAPFSQRLEPGQFQGLVSHCSQSSKNQDGGLLFENRADET